MISKVNDLCEQAEDANFKVLNRNSLRQHALTEYFLGKSCVAVHHHFTHNGEVYYMFGNQSDFLFKTFLINKKNLTHMETYVLLEKTEYI